MKKAIVIIPALNPEEVLVSIVASLKENLIASIIVVDDGSAANYKARFKKLKDDFACTVLEHPHNKGKGAALKTAFSYIKQHFEDDCVIATVDADGQHRVEDIMNCLKHYKKGHVLLGVRTFSKDIPLRSYVGNVLTKLVMRITTGVNVSDTQTGLRVFDMKGLDVVASLVGDRYEFESKALIAWHQAGIIFQEVAIQTVYEDNNSSSHFNPLLDSLRIYKTFVVYALSSLASSLVDLGMFYVLSTFVFKSGAHNIFIASIGARIISAIFNFNVNANVVFKAKDRFSALNYAVLALTQIIISGVLVSLLSSLTPISPTLIKAIVDSLIFVGSFLAQKLFVFKGQGVRHEY